MLYLLHLELPFEFKYLEVEKIFIYIYCLDVVSKDFNAKFIHDIANLIYIKEIGNIMSYNLY